MKLTKPLLELLAAMALFLSFVSAVNADVAADYLLDRPAFKATTKSADSLTFNLYDDQACTHQVFTHSLLAGDSSISYEKPTTQKVKGGTAPAKTILLHTTLPFTTPPGPLYLVVTGPGIVPVGGACQVQIGTGPYRSRYFTSGALNTRSLDATSTFQKIDDFLTFNKADVGSRIEVTLNALVLGGNFSGTNGVQFQVRIDGNPPTQGNLGAITTTNTREFLSIFAVFEGLPAGSHTVSVWARSAPAGTSNGVTLDAGGWGGRIIVKETY